MADIEMTCPTCSAAVTVSEFADPELLTCHVCGNRMKKPAGAGPVKTTISVRKGESGAFTKSEQDVRQGVAPTVAQQAAEGAMQQSSFHQKVAATRSTKGISLRSPHFYGSIALFLILGGILYYLRYQSADRASLTANIDPIAPFVFVAFYVIGVLKAFKDSVFQGALCLIPMYPVYYILVVSDDFYLRATFAALMFGVGEPSAYWLADLGRGAYDWVNDFIQSGGGDISLPTKPK